MTVRRRTLLRACAGAGVVAIGGCGVTRRATQVAVVWSGGELEQFRRVLAGYHRPVEVLSVGDDIDAFLRARHRAGTSPDVAVLPRPGLIEEYAARGWLSELDDELADCFPPVWNALLRRNGRLYGAWVKAAHKSLFWYLPSVLGSPPQTWTELLALVRELARSRVRAPLAVGAADGWVLTDWLENLLAALAPAQLHDDLASGTASWDAAPVRAAFGMLAEVWGTPGAFPGGGSRALLTQFEESVIQVVTERRAAMVFEGDFVSGVARRFGPADPSEVATFRFPSVNGVRPMVVGGDAAVVFDGSPAGHDLVAWLTERGSFLPWVRNGGFLTPNLGVPPEAYPAGPHRRFAEELTATKDVRFDLTDRLPGPLTGADGVGSWKILQDFFAAVIAPDADREAAINRATRQLTIARGGT